MKNLILIFSLILMSPLVHSQVSVEGVDINELEAVKYVQMLGYNKSLFGQKIIVTIDYGQKFNAFKSQLIKDKNDNNLVFNSMVDALNFMEENGWEYVNNTEYSTGSSNVSHFLLKRQKAK